MKYKSKVFSNNILLRVPYMDICFALLALYLFLFGIEFMMPEGINKTFSSDLKSVVLNLVILLFLITMMLYFLIDGFKPFHVHPFEMCKPDDFILVLLPFTPVAQYVISNQDTLTFYGGGYLIFTSLLLMSLIVIVPVFFSRLISRVLLMCLGLAICFVLVYMPILVLDNSWHKEGEFQFQVILFLFVFSISIFVYKLNDKLLKIMLFVFFITNTMYSILFPTDNFLSNNNSSSYISYKNKMGERFKPLENKVMKAKPDIYLLTYDSYVVNETMLQYGIDNSVQENYLRKNGFKIYNDNYSIAAGTWGTMARILNISLTAPSYEMQTQVFGGESYVHQTLRQQGYELAGILPDEIFWEKRKPTLDYFYPELNNEGYLVIQNSMLKGEFNFDAKQKFGMFNENKFIESKRNFMSKNNHPKFLHSHTGPGHSQNSGKCREDETALFKDRLIKANIEMKDDISTIQKNNPNALIIINGDHGPYLTANCTSIAQGYFLSKNKDFKVSRIDLQDRFGTFLAIKWPKNVKPVDQKLTITQDIFPSVFATLFADKAIFNELSLLPDTRNNAANGVRVKNGIISGGFHNGEKLYLNE
jgi:hypothetical protein